MQKAVFLLILFLSAGVSLFAQKVPSKAPLNPGFVRSMELQKSGKAPLPGTDVSGTGAMPPPGIVKFDNYLKNTKLKSAAFASVYDMRTTGLLTPVRGQTTNGCWAFATLGAVESQWLKLGLGSWDMAENNLKFCHGFADSRSYYGNHFMSTAYFARRSGPLVEADDPNTGVKLCPSGKTPAGYITDARYLPNDRDIIKQAILDHGAVYTMMYIDQLKYYRTSDFTYYCYDSLDVNHAVDIVGWDDNKVTAGGTGAWICKNSYGINWGEAGYFYISYNDKSVLDYNAYWPVHMDNVPNTQVYGYDDLGYIDSYGYDSPVGYVLVKYSASAKQIVSKVGTFAFIAGTTLEVDVFDTFDPVSNTLTGLLSHQSGLSCALPGYYTFDLSTPITVTQGKDFFVRVRYETPAYNWPIPVECYYAGYAIPAIESNVAWISDTGDNGSWYSVGSDNVAGFKGDPCVKVYAGPYPETLTWNGSTSNDWNLASNWTPASIPNASSDVIIPGVSTKPVVKQGLATPAVCKNLSIETGGSVTINADKALTVYGTLTNNAGTAGLNIASGASLITKGTVTGAATVNRDISGAKWHFISSPVSNATAVTFTGKYLQKLSEQTNTYTDITSVAEALVPVKGYALWGDADGFTAQYKGILNTGNQSLAVTRSTSDLNTSGWNLVGNPYPSSIDWDASGWTKTNLYNAIYMEKSGSWATYISGAAANGGSRFIAPGQGFMVRAGAIVGAGSLAMNNYVRTHNATTFLKSGNVSDSLIRIEVSGNGYTDEAVVRFMPEATVDFDGEYDAFKLFGYIAESAQIYTLGSVPLTINSVPHGISEIPLGIHADKSGEYTLAATHTGTLGDVTLEDVKTGIRTVFPADSYTFTFDAGENEQRFILHFNTLSTTKTDETENSLASVFSSGQNILINLRSPLKGDILVYNLSGQLVAGRYSAVGMNSISMPCSGIYLVRVITPEKTMVKKVWIR